MIENAENIVNGRKIKEGPLSLNSAAILCENLKSQEIQREFNKKKRKEEKKKNEMMNKEHFEQAVKWIDDYNQKQLDKRKRFDEYKTQLGQQVEDRAKTREDKKAARLQKERAHIAQHEKNQKDLIEKDKESAENKKEALKQNGLEAISMAQQKRARQKHQDEIQTAIAKIHTEGKEKIKELIVQQEKKMKIQNIQAKQVLQVEAAKLDVENKIKLIKEQEWIEKIKAEKLKILEEKEKTRLEDLNALKEERAGHHQADRERLKEQELEKKKEDLQYFQNRVKNDKVSQEYTKVKFQKKCENCRENRQFLIQQIIENNDKEIAEKLERQKFDKSEVENMDKQYFSYSQELIDDAKAKDRPTLPILKTIHQYKKHNFLDIKVHQLPHVISNVPIGRAYQIEETPNVVKSKFRIRYEADHAKMTNPYRGTHFTKKFNFL
jgi:hypothetical protein